jgi:hypothetical protein
MVCLTVALAWWRAKEDGGYSLRKRNEVLCCLFQSRPVWQGYSGLFRDSLKFQQDLAAMLDLSMPCGRVTPEMALQLFLGWSSFGYPTPYRPVLIRLT